MDATSETRERVRGLVVHGRSQTLAIEIGGASSALVRNIDELTA